MTQNDSHFKVADRQISSEDGSVRNRNEPPQQPNFNSGRNNINPDPPLDESESSQSMNFQTLILSLSTTAMLQMGLLAAPGQNQPEKDLEGARQTIDILQILKDKTTGNLTEEESQILEASLFDLKMWYLKATNNVRL